MSDVVVRGRYVNQRLAVAPMETHGFAAAPGPDGSLTIWASNQMPHYTHGQVAGVLGVDPSTVHLITPQVGGGFGGKAAIQHEYTSVAAAAQRLGRPVVWVPTRTEDMQAAPHSRGQVQYAELGCRRDGTFTGLRVRLVGDAGAYPNIGAWLPGGTRRMSHGTYKFDAIDFDVAVAVTNTVPMGAYRGAGRPEATALLERLVDQASHELDIDPIELRNRNLLADDVFPFTTITGNQYDTGRYRLPLQTAAEAIDYDALRRDQQARRERGDTIQLGIGVATYVEITAGGGSGEFGKVEVAPDGSATVYCGTFSHGQGHQTAYAMIVSAQTGIPVDRITLVDGDTQRVKSGGGTGGSRSLQLGGSAVHRATEAMVDARQAVGGDGARGGSRRHRRRRGAGHGRRRRCSRHRPHVGRARHARRVVTRRPARGGGGVHRRRRHVPVRHPHRGRRGRHRDRSGATGAARRRRRLRHGASTRCSSQGQQHGGIGSGVGQALYEEVRFDAAGNPITSNFADYGIPSAAEMPSFETHSTETPTPINPLGAKGIGEAATIGSTPAIQNAVIDAVSHLGVRHIDMPCTPERVWAAIQSARNGDADPWRDPPPIFATLPKGVKADEEEAAAADGI